MPDHWGFVVAAYAIAAAVLLGYWRRLLRLARDLDRLGAEGRSGVRSHAVTETAHPRSEPGSRTR